MLQQRWQDLLASRPSARSRRPMSPAFWGQYQAVRPFILRYLHGRVLDVGCGAMPYRAEIAQVAESHHGLDRAPQSGGAVIMGDAEELAMISDQSYDSLLCLEVLEHLPRPGKAIAAMYRVLKPGGYLVLSVPHLSRLHDLPHDYYRYTVHGIRHLLQAEGFELVDWNTRGGLFSFLGHQLSFLLLSASGTIPGVRQLVWHVNRWLVTIFCMGLDRWLGTDRYFPLGYVVVARKPEQKSGSDIE